MMSGFDLQPHRYAELFPLMSPQEYEELKSSISAHGLRQPVVLFEGRILDGRNRYKVCFELGIEPVFRDFDRAREGSALDFAFDLNVRRRHLNESQRAMIAAKLAGLPAHRPEKSASLQTSSSSEGPISIEAAAEKLSVSARTVASAKKVQERGSPDLIRAIEHGKITVSAAERVVTLEPETQREIIKAADAGRVNVARTIIKAGRRAARERELGARQLALPAKKYGVIYCDYPRHFEVYSRATGLDRSPDNHYPTMTFAQIVGLPVSDLAAPDCVLFFWSTGASLADDLEIMAEWGFAAFRPRDAFGKLMCENGVPLPPVGGGSYRCHQIWLQPQVGLGYWFRDNHEILLVGARGNIVAPAPGTQDRSVIPAPLGPHSAKPNYFVEMIERLFPTVPKIELFARRARPAWDAWGYEAPEIKPAPAPEESNAQTAAMLAVAAYHRDSSS
jgi:N6-adenosine-specific RNA methylase IME4/ParB-like chromosome segregation protein Spo0J